MALTRSKYDDIRHIKYMQESTYAERWILNTPGWGSTPSYMEDVHIRLQGFGGNLQTEKTDLETELMKYRQNSSRWDIPSQPNIFTSGPHASRKQQYSTNSELRTDQSRTTYPSWECRSLQCDYWQTPIVERRENRRIEREDARYNMNSRDVNRAMFDQFKMY